MEHLTRVLKRTFPIFRCTRPSTYASEFPSALSANKIQDQVVALSLSVTMIMFPHGPDGAQGQPTPIKTIA